MPSSEAIAKHLPYLRRYARALAGSQRSGDAYVGATLEAIVKEPGLLDPIEQPKVVLYRTFSTIWNSLPINGVTDASDDADTLVDARLTHLTLRPRQAFLLTSLEGFSEEEAAQVLSVGATELHELVEEAGREMAADIATGVLIIEDEMLVAMDLESLSQGLGHRVVGIARTHAEAITISRIKQPGLILADIQLADGSSGMDAVNELLSSFEVPVIFITAYPERFLTGERPEPAFLIAKPFEPATLSALISQALFFGRNAARRERLAS
jgi:DNA-directed RNA polymerase specialized sigma24 family protein/CheY-like chemotaxis protein